MLRTVVAAGLLGIYTVIMGTFCIVTWPLFPTGWLVQRMAGLWARLTLFFCGAHMEVKGLENVDRNGVYVFTSNHLSTFDILAVLQLQPARRVRFVAKRSLFLIPFFGWAIALAGYIAIDRGNRKRAMDSMQVALRKIQRGTSVVVYPEGTRSDDGSLLPFKTGSFLMAIRARVPVVPVTMVGTHRLQPKGRFLAVPGTFRIIFDAPIPTTNLQERDRAALAARVRGIIAHRLAEEGQLTQEELARALSEPATVTAPLPAQSASR